MEPGIEYRGAGKNKIRRIKRMRQRGQIRQIGPISPYRLLRRPDRGSLREGEDDDAEQDQREGAGFLLHMDVAEIPRARGERDDAAAPADQRNEGNADVRQIQGVEVQKIGHDEQDARERDRPAPDEFVLLSEADGSDQTARAEDHDEVDREPELDGAMRDPEGVQEVFVVERGPRTEERAEQDQVLIAPLNRR